MSCIFQHHHQWGNGSFVFGTPFLHIQTLSIAADIQLNSNRRKEWSALQEARNVLVPFLPCFNEVGVSHRSLWTAAECLLCVSVAQCCSCVHFSAEKMTLCTKMSPFCSPHATSAVSGRSVFSIGWKAAAVTPSAKVKCRTQWQSGTLHSLMLWSRDAVRQYRSSEDQDTSQMMR